MLQVVSPVVSFELYVSTVPLMAGSLLPVPGQSAWEHCRVTVCVCVSTCKYTQGGHVYVGGSTTFKHYCMFPSVHDCSSIARPAMEVSVGTLVQLLICALVYSFFHFA